MGNNLKPLKRIAAIHDMSGLGKCSLTVALPVVSATGVECACIPTALLSTHTGGFSGWTLCDLSGEMLPIAEHWRSVGAAFDGIYSGYIASPEQALLLERVIDVIAGEDTMIIVDPVMADNGEYYVNFNSRMCEAFSRLVARAHIITPNVTEAALLTGIPYRDEFHDIGYIDSLFDGLAALGPEIIAITGVRPSENEIGMVVRDGSTGEKCSAMRPSRDGVFYGTGDIFASAFAALIVRGAPVGKALDVASALVGESVERSVERNAPRRFGVDFEGALPEYIARVQRIFE
ncbi:MAG: pyridoxamine kinase [Clostridia bacterium]|nr:pyridoxamine kinase [Clostridia bacterium]